MPTERPHKQATPRGWYHRDIGKHQQPVWSHFSLFVTTTVPQSPHLKTSNVNQQLCIWTDSFVQHESPQGCNMPSLGQGHHPSDRIPCPGVPHTKLSILVPPKSPQPPSLGQTHSVPGSTTNICHQTVLWTLTPDVCLMFRGRMNSEMEMIKLCRGEYMSTKNLKLSTLEFGVFWNCLSWSTRKSS